MSNYLNTPLKQVVLATRNEGKVREFNQMFAAVGWEAVSLRTFPEAPEVVEDGDTFAENALKKATAIAAYTGLPTIGDDSGLEVDALNGAPGVYSARYAGESASDEANLHKLLVELQGVPMAKRTARFCCVLALVRPGMPTITAEGYCDGVIVHQPAGENGFGYDPVFFLPQRMCTMAQLQAEEKNRISHRSQALHKLLEKVGGTDR